MKYISIFEILIPVVFISIIACIVIPAVRAHGSFNRAGYSTTSDHVVICVDSNGNETRHTEHAKNPRYIAGSRVAWSESHIRQMADNCEIDP